MKKGIIFYGTLLLISGSIQAQTEVSAGLTRGKEYGVAYSLPYTEIELTIRATKHVYKPGDFCKYAERYLRLRDVSPEAREYWTLDKVQAGVVGVPDKERTYFVKMKDKTTAPLMELTEDGVVRSINLPYSGGKKKDVGKQQEVVQARRVDPRSFLTEEILMANSTAKMAELVAKEIYDIRESRNALLRGEADNMPKDGEQLKIMLESLQRQETAMTEMFTGTTMLEEKTYTIRIKPQEMEDVVAFRFSRKLGLTDKDDLAGEPVYISIADMHSVNIPTDNDSKKQLVEGVAYNAPGRGHVILEYQDAEVFNGELPLTQFGTVEYLAPVLFNKGATTKVRFNVNTGGLEKVDME